MTVEGDPPNTKVGRGLHVIVPPSIAVGIIAVAVRMWSVPAASGAPVVPAVLDVRQNALENGYAALNARVSATESYLAAVDNRQQKGFEQLMVAVMQIKESIGRVEGAMGTKQ